MRRPAGPQTETSGRSPRPGLSGPSRCPNNRIYKTRTNKKIIIEEPDTESAISILRGIKEKYETHHKVQIKDDAIIAAVELSQRYITNRAMKLLSLFHWGYLVLGT